MTIRVQLQKRARITARTTLGLRGYQGWVPQFAMIEDGDRRVLQVVDYVNGEGERPPYIGWYVGTDGLSAEVADAIDIRGSMAWSPVIALAEDGLRVVLHVVDWTGGTGSMPVTGYIADTGFSDDIGNGVDVRGYQGWAPVFGVVADNERRVYQLVDWVGGGGVKPSILSDTDETLFLGEAGFTTDLAQAVDVRGPIGIGQDASDTSFTPYGSLSSTNVQGALQELEDHKAEAADLNALAWSLGALATKNTVGTADINNSAVTVDKLGSSSVTTIKVADDAVTNDKLANMLANTIKGRLAGTGDPLDLTAAQVATLLAQYVYQPGDLKVSLSTNAPAGFIKANGATLSRATYAALWAHAQASGLLAATEGTKSPGGFGPGDGATTFSIPDLRGVFIRSADDGRGVDAGRVLGSEQAHRTEDLYAQIAPTGAAPAGIWAQRITTPSYSVSHTVTGTLGTSSSSHTFGTGISPLGTGETRPRNVAYHFFIKY